MAKMMSKYMLKMLIILGIIFGLIVAYKLISGFIFAKVMQGYKNPPISVSTTQVSYQEWQSQIKAVGSLRAIRGVDVTTEIAGLVRNIYFTPGTDIETGTLLVELNIDADVAQLHSLEAAALLAKTVYKRDLAQYAIQAVSKATLDSDEADLKSKEAQVAEQAAIIAKKVIRAPFGGHLGISAVNPGQFLNAGDKIVTLQTLDPIYVDFYIPQQILPQISIGQSVHLTSDSYHNQIFSGKITTIDPKVDVATRNVQVEATIESPQHLLLPGMFGSVLIMTGNPQKFLTVSQTAISYNPYGDIIYVVKSSAKNKNEKPNLTVIQRFIVVGETRGDQVAILKGLQAGETIVTAGQLKLRNGSPVVINNAIVPSNNPAPTPEDE